MDSKQHKSHTQRTSRRGFTIVELLIVVVVIAILAAIVIVSYNGISRRAIETSMKSDLRSASNILELDLTSNGTYPATSSAANNGHRIRKMTPSGVVTTVAGNGSAGMVDGTGTAAQFNYPTDLAVDTFGFIYVVDQGSNAVRQISPAGVVTTIAGGGTAGYSDGAGSTAQFNGITGIAVDSTGTLYVADGDNNRIRKIVQ
jgi:prepilin-type N-terminal cleavage/methylation domain-containing protein